MARNNGDQQLVGSAEMRDKTLRDELKEYRKNHSKPWYLL